MPRHVFQIQRIEPEGFDTLGNPRYSYHDVDIYGTKKKVWAALLALIEKSEGLYTYVKYPKPEKRNFNYSLLNNGYFKVQHQQPERGGLGKIAYFTISVTRYEVL